MTGKGNRKALRKEGEDLFEPENADLLEADEEAETEDGEMLVEEAPSEPEEIEAFEEEEYLEAEEADDLSEMEGEDIAEGAYEGGDEELSEADSEPELTEEMPEAEEAEPDMITEEGTDIDMTAGERTGETMEEQKTRKTEPILPPDIQRMIDEIEGVIPPQEEIEKTPVKRTLKRKEEPRENMGKVADSLRIDNEDFGDEDYLDDEYEFDDELDETGREKYFAEEEKSILLKMQKNTLTKKRRSLQTKKNTSMKKRRSLQTRKSTSMKKRKSS